MNFHSDFSFYPRNFVLPKDNKQNSKFGEVKVEVRRTNENPTHLPYAVISTKMCHFL